VRHLRVDARVYRHVNRTKRVHVSILSAQAGRR
jgi:hypothetical protein